MKDVIEDEREPVPKYSLGSDAPTMKARQAEVLGVVYNSHRPCPALESAMVKDDITETRNGSKRIILFRFPGELCARTRWLKEAATEARWRSWSFLVDA